MAEQNEQLRYWIWLSLVFGAGSTKLSIYLKQLASPQAVYEAVQTGMIRNLSPAVQKNMLQHTLGEADSLAYYCRTHQIELIPYDSELYPPMLRHIGTPPILLTAWGNTELLSNPLSFSVVGTRNPSPYSEKVTNAIVSALAQRDFTIVSGCAKGIDAIAHAAALDAGGTTIAVLGCGVNVNYPRENQILRERMISSGKGLLLSEYLPGTQPVPANFPKRNRILSGLGYATAVMEAAMRSGSLITADCAAEQGKYLFCVPPADLFDARYAGTIPLLRDGAIPLMSHEDVLMVYYDRYPQYYQGTDGLKDSERLVFTEESIGSAGNSEKRLEPVKTEKESAIRSQKEMDVPVEENLPEDETEKQIVTYLREHGSVYVDDIAAALDMDLSELLSTLTMLELDGFVESLFGKQYRAL
ncbi:MAG: DNA-processing protein DprA [Oscillospiraceae bacterium]|nr:DNA-processing protein DprA [Oscillospiraceae bacterium]